MRLNEIKQAPFNVSFMGMVRGVADYHGIGLQLVGLLDGEGPEEFPGPHMKQTTVAHGEAP